MCVLLQARLVMRKSSWQGNLSCQPRGVWRFHLFRSHNATKKSLLFGVNEAGCGALNTPPATAALLNCDPLR